jgi:hypothetical protein
LIPVWDERFITALIAGQFLNCLALPTNATAINTMDNGMKNPILPLLFAPI